MTTANFEIRDQDFERRARENFAIDLIEPGRCMLSLPFKDSLAQQHGYFHGGIIASLADVSGGYAAFSLLNPEQTNVTVEFKLNYLAPGIGDRLEAEAQVVKPGRTLTICQVDIRTISADGTENRCATALATYMSIDSH